MKQLLLILLLIFTLQRRYINGKPRYQNSLYRGFFVIIGSF